MADITPQSVASMDPNFELRYRDLSAASAQEYLARSQGNQVRWARPLGFNASLFDVEAMSTPFDRSVSNAAYAQSVSNPAQPGTSGDIVATTTMIDQLANMERAFRARFMRRPRAMALALGRKSGQGDQLGPFIQNGVEYLRSVLVQAKAEQP